MEAKEKAKDLYDKYYRLTAYYDRGSEEPSDYSHLNIPKAKQCALIAVDEIIISIKFLNDSKWYVEQDQYWQQVKQEINSL